ncbi:MAG: signal peptidase I [Acidimicrobiales bacterium]
MNLPGDVRPARPPTRSRRARFRRRRLARRAAPPPVLADTAVGEQRPDDSFVDVAPAGFTFDPPHPPASGRDDDAELFGAPLGVGGRAAQPARSTMTLVEDAPPTTGQVAEMTEMDDAPPGSKRRHSPMRNTVEWVVIIGAALLAALVIKTYLLQAFYIPSASMEPTLEIQDRVLVNKLSYRLHDIHRGDVVVFERPRNDTGQIRDLIKRVVALPGETVEGKDGLVYVDDRPLREPYLPRGTVTGQFGPQHVPEGYVWVMGDNRGNSSDSRVFGAISESRIIGRAFVRVWPVSAFSLL